MKKILTLLAMFLLSFTVIAEQLPAATSPRKNATVLLHTTAGDITILLDRNAAPKTVANFLQYVNEGFYNNTLFHRVIPDFMIQGGGFQPGMVEKPTHDPVVNESANGMKNLAGTIAMARTQDPDSATAQFFINLVDNAYLDASASKPGYTVFGKVTNGMAVVQRIAGVTTGSRGSYQDVPVQDVVIINASLLP